MIITRESRFDDIMDSEFDKYETGGNCTCVRLRLEGAKDMSANGGSQLHNYDG